jgi:hypothetical protein
MLEIGALTFCRERPPPLGPGDDAHDALTARILERVKLFKPCHLDRLRRIPRSGRLSGSGEIPTRMALRRGFREFYRGSVPKPHFPSRTCSELRQARQRSPACPHLHARRRRTPSTGMAAKASSGSLHSSSVFRSAGSLGVGRDDSCGRFALRYNPLTSLESA